MGEQITKYNNLKESSIKTLSKSPFSSFFNELKKKFVISEKKNTQVLNKLLKIEINYHEHFTVFVLKHILRPAIEYNKEKASEFLKTEILEKI